MNKMVQNILRSSAKLALGAFVLAASFGMATAQNPTELNAPLWKIDAKASGATGSGSWFANDNNTRGFAYNPATGNLLVVSRTGGLKIIKLNAATGDSVGVMNVTGVSGGTFTGTLIDVTPTGRIFMVNLTTNTTTSPLKIYTWENENSVPAVAFSGAVNTLALRFGDSFRVDWTDGARDVYVGGNDQNPNLAKFTWANNALTLSAVFNFGAAGNTTMRAVRGMAPIAGEDSLWINEFDYTVKKISTVTGAIGTVIPALPTGTFDALKSSLWLDYAVINNRKLFASFPSSLIASGQTASLFDATTKTELAYTAAGLNGNGNASGGPLFDVANKRMYLLATNNHIASYDISAFVPADPVTVKFTVNTSTIRDTVGVNDLVQIRGVVNNQERVQYFGQNFNWGSSSLALANAGGDYWSANVKLQPGDVLKYKIYTAKRGPDGAWVDHATGGWEGGDDKFYTVPSDASGMITLPVIFYNRTNPIAHSKVDTIAVRFRVNVGAAFATGDVNDLSIVGVRGTVVNDWGASAPVLTREPMIEGNRNVFYSGIAYLPASNAGRAFQYKYVVENGATILWDTDPNRQGRVGQSDTTIYFSFFQNRRPPSRPVVNASLQFAVNVGVLEELDLFNRALGDRVFVPGGFNGWNTAADGTGAAAYNETFDAWTRAFSITEEVGATVTYKYFVRWDASRFLNTSPNYIANLAEGAGWEEPGITGGGNRVHTYTDASIQTVIDDAADGLAFFNGVPSYGVIRETRGAFTTMPVTFRVDMTAALSHTTAFNPTTDSLFLAVQTPIWALTQGIPSNNDAFASNSATINRILFKAVEGQPNIYELVYQMRLPADNMIGFALAYRKADGTTVVNGGGFDAGRRYYRYVTPYDSRDRDNVLWPDAFTLQPIVWKATDLDFEDVPTYNNGVGVDRNADLASEYALSQNYPNPFNPSTTISFNLPQSGNVTLTVYNVLGQQVATLVNGALNAGTHSVAFNASRLASGVYIYELRAGSFVQQKRMMLVK
jgi:hypothetical protein